MNWKEFLSDVSKTLINSNDLNEDIENESSHWLGYSGITDEEIIEHEARLNTTLPPTYKNFLKTSNGFKQFNCFIWNILPINKIDWIKNYDYAFYDLYATQFDFINAPDKEYFLYGKSQASANFRSEFLIKTLVISSWGDSAILLLNPEVKFGDEWEAWMFANWYPGATRYKSFEDLMKSEYASYLDLLGNEK